MARRTKRRTRPGGVARRIATLVATVASLAPASWPALAEEGSFRLLASYSQDYMTIDHTDGQVSAGSLKGTFTVLESSGAPFMEGTHSIALCVVFVRTSEAGFDLDAPCTMTDGEGDRLYLDARRSSGDIEAGGGGEGRFELLGGTGKYAGIGGLCPYETAYLPGERIVTERDCTWRRVAE
ncbi:MAG: hypothetical protein OXU19_20080 [bacterium]|nr:hypothetical protein [bacterium]